MVKIQIIPLKFTILDLNEKNQTFKIKRTKFKECNLYFCLNLLIVISIYNINDFILVILKMSYKPPQSLSSHYPLWNQNPQGQLHKENLVEHKSQMHVPSQPQQSQSQAHMSPFDFNSHNTKIDNDSKYDLCDYLPLLILVSSCTIMCYKQNI